MDEIRGYLRAKREERNWTPEELADKCGVTAGTIRNLERGSALSWQTLMSVCEVLGVRLKPEKVRQ